MVEVDLLDKQAGLGLTQAHLGKIAGGIDAALEKIKAKVVADLTRSNPAAATRCGSTSSGAPRWI